MVNLSQEDLDEIEKDLLGFKNIKPFEYELIMTLRKMERGFHYAEENRERQTSEIISVLENIAAQIQKSD